MRRSVLVALTAASLMAVPAVSSAATASDSTIGNARVCATAKTGFAACHAHVRTKGAKPDATTSRTSGFISSDLRSAYKLTTDSTATVAIVDAYANPNAAADLAVYRDKTGLPALTDGQFTQFNQSGLTAPL